MSGHVVKYTYFQIISVVLAARNPNTSIAHICWDNDITPQILNHWCQQFSKCQTEELRRLVEIYNPKVTDRREVVSVKN